MGIIDFHCHIYPDKIARAASDNVGDFYNMGMFHADASVDALLAACEGSGIERFVVHSVALAPKTVRPINEFIAAAQAAHPEFIGFGTVHADCADLKAEVDHIVELGLHGIKIHPDSQRFDLDCPQMMEVYAYIEGRLPVIMHTGDYRYDYSHPRRLVRVLDEFPRLVVDAAHFGGWSIFEKGYDLLRDKRCFVDCSSSFHWLGVRRARELIELYGPDRVLFGADFPMWDPPTELACLCACGLPAADFERVTHANAEGILGIA